MIQRLMRGERINHRTRRVVGHKVRSVCLTAHLATFNHYQPKLSAVVLSLLLPLPALVACPPRLPLAFPPGLNQT